MTAGTVRGEDGLAADAAGVGVQARGADFPSEGRQLVQGVEEQLVEAGGRNIGAGDQVLADLGRHATLYFDGGSYNFV